MPRRERSKASLHAALMAQEGRILAMADVL